MIRVYTRNKATAKALRDAFTAEPVGGFHHESPEWQARPRRADYVVSKGGLSSQLERYAAYLWATPIVLPEAITWLVEQAKRRYQEGNDTVIVGRDYMEPPK